MLVFFYGSCAPRDLHSFPTRRSSDLNAYLKAGAEMGVIGLTVYVLFIASAYTATRAVRRRALRRPYGAERSEEHTSELQSLAYLVCRLLLEKKKQRIR